MPKLQPENDAILKVVRSSVYESDLLWSYGISKFSANSTTKHGTSSVVEKMGKKCCWYSAGDFVIASFTHGRGQCSIYLARFDGNHLNEGHFINSVYQSDYLNFHYANWVLLRISRKRTYYN